MMIIARQACWYLMSIVVPIFMFVLFFFFKYCLCLILVFAKCWPHKVNLELFLVGFSSLFVCLFCGTRA
jgi:hypothetical protein